MDSSSVIARANEINDLSLDYHLAHASLACEMIIQAEVKVGLKQEFSRINKEKERALKRDDIVQFERLCQDEGKLERRNTVRNYVEYIDGGELSENSGRVIFFENHFTISLSKSLLEKSMREDGTYTPYVSKLRWVMAHELGHIALHYRDLFTLKGTQGSWALSSEKKEEANIFADELIRLWGERNKKMLDDGSLVAHFTENDSNGLILDK